MILRFFLLGVFILISNQNSKAQGNNLWVNKILSQILKNEVQVFDERFTPLPNEKIKLVEIDTVINDQWTRPKIVDNIFHASFDGVIVKSEIVFDTSTNQNNSNYIDFSYRNYDANGNYSGNQIAFLVPRINLLNPRSNNNTPKALLSTSWRLHQITDDGTKLKLDSCHLKYRLQLKKDFNYHQFYIPNSPSCNISDMKEELEIGIEDNTEIFYTYQNKIQGHYLSSTHGVWKAEDDRLILINLEGKTIRSFRIKELNKQSLILKITEKEYYLEFKRSND